MGAYYEAALRRPGGIFFRYSSWRTGSGAKLLEHSYLPNSYVNAIVKMIYFKPAYIVWLCDYYEEEGFNWEEVLELKMWKPKQNHPLYICLIVNLDKKEYINIKKLINLIAKDVSKFNFIYSYISEYNEEVYIDVYHPLPFLTNCSEHYMGGGDYPDDYEHRTRWKCDLIVSLPLECEPELKQEGFQDITEISLVPVESGYRISDNYQAFLLLRKLMKQVGANSIKSAVKMYFEKEACKLSAGHRKISEFFKEWIGTKPNSPFTKTQLQFNWTATIAT